jgi:hypothetical protein
MSVCDELMMVAESLQKWVDRTNTGDERLHVCVSITPDSADAISIGDVTVYCSESQTDLSFEACRIEFLKHVHGLFGFWHEALGWANQQSSETDASTEITV